MHDMLFSIGVIPGNTVYVIKFKAWEEEPRLPSLWPTSTIIFAANFGTRQWFTASTAFCVVELDLHDLATREQPSADWPILQISPCHAYHARTLQSALRSRANSLRSTRPKIGCTDNSTIISWIISWTKLYDCHCVSIDRVYRAYSHLVLTLDFEHRDWLISAKVA